MDSIVALDFFILLLSAVFVKGLKIDIKQQRDVWVQAGDTVQLHCPLTHSRDVRQVMWQKVTHEERVTVVTCLASRHKINPQFSGRMGRRGRGIEKCILEVHEVTGEDQGCYLCLFITSSEVAHTGKVCLHFHELHGPVLNVTNAISTEESESNATVPAFTEQHVVPGPRGFIMAACSLPFACVAITVTVLLIVKRKHQDSVCVKEKNVEMGAAVTPLSRRTGGQSGSAGGQSGSAFKRTPRRNESQHSKPSKSSRKLIL